MQSGVTRTATIALGLTVVIALAIVAGVGSGARNTPEIAAGRTEVKEPAEIQKRIDLSHLPHCVQLELLGHRI